MFEKRPAAKHINKAREELDRFLSYDTGSEDEGMYITFEDIQQIRDLLDPDISDEVYYHTFGDGKWIHP